MQKQIGKRDDAVKISSMATKEIPIGFKHLKDNIQEYPDSKVLEK